MAKDDKAIATRDTLAASIFTGDASRIKSLIERNLGGAPLTPGDLTRIQVPTGGSTTFEFATARGEQSTKELNVVILYTNGRRSYWEEAFAGDKRVPPTCFSNDMLVGSRSREYNELPEVGSVPVYGECDTCHFAQWGTKRGPDGAMRNGQACKSVRGVYFMSEYGRLPMWIAFPPTSLPMWKKYLLSLAAEELAYTDVVTRITLQKAGNDIGSYAVPVLSMAAELGDADREQAQALSAWITPYLSRLSAEQMMGDADDA